MSTTSITSIQSAFSQPEALNLELETPSFPGGKRYAAAGPALRQIFGGRVQRIALDGGFTCPTRDGSLGNAGCLYCDADGARARHLDPVLPVAEQLQRGVATAGQIMAHGKQINLAANASPITRFIAYFQAYTNTYAPPAELRRIYEQSLSDERVVGMAISTRPDCLSESVLDVLEEFSRRTFLWVEVGIQSKRNATLAAIERGHDVEAYIDAASRLRARGIRFCAHLIFGLPGDSPEDMMGAAELLNETHAWGVKVHNLYVDKHSRLAKIFEEGKLRLLERREYLDLLIEFLARLSPGILIHRFLGSLSPDRLLAPAWSSQKTQMLNDLDRLLKEGTAWQGKKCSL